MLLLCMIPSLLSNTLAVQSEASLLRLSESRNNNHDYLRSWPWIINHHVYTRIIKEAWLVDGIGLVLCIIVICYIFINFIHLWSSLYLINCSDVLKQILNKFYGKVDLKKTKLSLKEVRLHWQALLVQWSHFI